MNEELTNPWRTLKSRTVYENPWISVRHDEVIQPDGAPGLYGVIQFHNRAVGVLPLDAEGYTYLVGQFRYPLGQYSWEIPEGGSAVGETELAAAQRELREETGLVAQTWAVLGRAHLSNSVSDEEAVFFLATDLQQGEASPEGNERLQVRRVHFDEVLRMTLAGELTDALSVLAILRYALLRAG